MPVRDYIASGKARGEGPIPSAATKIVRAKFLSMVKDIRAFNIAA